MSNVKGPDSAQEREQAFEQLVMQYQTMLLRTCYLYLGEKTLAEDAVQDTFLKAYRNWDAFRGDSSRRTWLMKIAVNTCRDLRSAGCDAFACQTSRSHTASLLSGNEHHRNG